MGSAKIVSNLGDGLYTVELVKGQSRLTTDKSAINDRINDCEDKLTDLNSDLADLTYAQSAAGEVLKDAVAVFASAALPTKAMRDAVKNAQTEYLKAQSKVRSKQAEINMKELELTSLEKKLAEIDVLLEPEYARAWCADYEIELSGTVGTLEVNGQAEQIIIMPGGGTGEGKLYDANAMTPSGVFYNLALMAWWQKWKPTYRIGTIIEVYRDTDTCDVAIGAERSPVQGFPINQDGTPYTIVQSAVDGWSDFATRNPDHPLVTQSTSTTLPWDDQLKADLDSVQADVNNRYTYRLDQDLYQKLEHWSSMGDGGSGDCEDFAITKAEKLIAMGYPASAIHIEVGLAPNSFWGVGGDTEMVGHAWLVVQTDNGDYCLDNRFQGVVRNDSTGYKDRQRQTGSSWSTEGVLLSGVPIEYMNADSNVFFKDDRVVVKFMSQNWQNPKVIGFETYPRIDAWGFGLCHSQWVDTGGESAKPALYINQYEVSEIGGLSILDPEQSLEYDDEDSYDRVTMLAYGYSRSKNAYLYAYWLSGTSKMMLEACTVDGDIIHSEWAMTASYIPWSLAGMNCHDGILYISMLGTGYSGSDATANGYMFVYPGNTYFTIWQLVNPFGIYSTTPWRITYVKVTRCSDGTLLWAATYNDQAAKVYKIIFKHTTNAGVVLKTVTLEDYAPYYYTGWTAGSDSGVVNFIKEVDGKLFYSVTRSIWTFSQDISGYDPETGNPIGGPQHEDQVISCELRLCQDKTRPDVYTVLDTAPQDSWDHTDEAGNSQAGTYTQPWTDVARVLAEGNGYYAAVLHPDDTYDYSLGIHFHAAIDLFTETTRVSRNYLPELGTQRATDSMFITEIK